MGVAQRMFLSYASGDRAKVLAIRQLYAVAGVQAFVDAADIRPGADWERALAAEVEAADAMLVFWSARAAESKWVAREYTAFMKRWPERPCSAFRVDGTPLPPALAKRQAIDGVPLVDELGDLARRLSADGVSARERRRRLRERARERGVDVDDPRLRWVWWILAGGLVAKAAEVALGAPVVVATASAAGVAAVAGVVALVIAGTPVVVPAAGDGGLAGSGGDPPAIVRADDEGREDERPAEAERPVEAGRPAGGEREALVPEPSAPAARPGATPDLPATALRPAMVLIRKGTFVMGSPPEEAGRQDDEPQRQVDIARDFYVGATEVTQAEWTAVMGGNQSAFRGDDLPVDSVSWFAATEYLNRLSGREGLGVCYPRDGCTGDPAAGDFQCPTVTFAPAGCAGYRLPTEEEWEYAARAGTKTPIYSGAMDLSADEITSEAVQSIGWYGRNSGSTTHPVSQKGANPWGLYDVIGNVLEWTDSLPSPGRSEVVLRGCGYVAFARYCRAAARGGGAPASRVDALGFRPARSAFP